MTKTAQTITIEELKQADVDILLANSVYSRFIPIKCNRCGKNAFSRRIFRIMGVQKEKHNDDHTQNILQHYFLTRKKIEYIFFRGNRDKFYADSAICLACQSTARNTG